MECIFVYPLTSQCWEKESVEWAKIEGIVRRYFAALPDYQASDIVSRGHVRQLFQQLRDFGWACRDERSICRATLADDHFLVRWSRSQEGRALLKQMADDPLAYDRLDRISWRPGGPTILSRIEWMDRMGTAPVESSDAIMGHLGSIWARNGYRLQSTPKEVGRPTGRIYTVSDLLARIRASYEKELVGRGGSSRTVRRASIHH